MILSMERDDESGYASGSSSEASIPEVFFTKPHLKFLNRQLQGLEPQDILRWSFTSLPSLYQSTSFGLSGLVALDILSKLKIPRPQQVDLIFLDTLHISPRLSGSWTAYEIGTPWSTFMYINQQASIRQMNSQQSMVKNCGKLMKNGMIGSRRSNLPKGRTESSA